MRIQNNTNVNFQAKRIMSVDKHFNSNHFPKTEVFDIFKLDKAKDINFVKQCYVMLTTRKTRDLSSVQKNLKVFFESFLKDRSTDYNDYFLSIKDGEQLVGGLVSTPFNDTLHILQAFHTLPKDYNLETLLYAFLDDSKKDYKGYKINTNGWLKDFKSNQEILPEKFAAEKRKISQIHQSTIFKTQRDKDVDLEEFLGIKDFELEVNPSLR